LHKRHLQNYCIVIITDFLNTQMHKIVKILKLKLSFHFPYLKTTPPLDSCRDEISFKFCEVRPQLKSRRPLPKITGAIPMRYSSYRLSLIKVSDWFALPKTNLELVSAKTFSTGLVQLHYKSVNSEANIKD